MSASPEGRDSEGGARGAADPWTVKALILAAADFLGERGIERPRLDVELLLAHVLGCGRLDLWVRHEMPVEDADRARFRALIKERRAGRPVAHLLGEREFYGRAFAVDSRCLVPRPETEHLIDRALEWVRRERPEGAVRAADVGTGSGCIAVTLTAEIERVGVDAVDVSGDALEVARANAARHGVADRVVFHRGDLLAPLRDLPPFDLICSNPPYILDAERADLPVEVRDHEPALALFSGDDPVAFHKRLLAEPARLVPGGLLLMELPDGGEGPLRNHLGRDHPEWKPLETELDLMGIPRIFVAMRRRQGAGGG